jgi:hypothetical protein
MNNENVSNTWAFIDLSHLSLPNFFFCHLHPKLHITLAFVWIWKDDASIFIIELYNFSIIEK